MKKILNKEQILATSSGWVAAFLNIFPGLGVGYIYQRRWLPYFLTGGAIVLWLGLGLILQKNSEPTSKEQLIGLAGLFFISIISSFESYLAYKNALKIVDENQIQEKEEKTKKGWFSK